MADFDVVIVGAGAAGVGAARRLAGSGLSVAIVEASARVGGRAWTLGVADLPLDLGCGWLHSAERNPWVDIAESAGFAIDRSPTSWGEQYRNLGFPAADRRAAGEAYDAFDRALREKPPRSDRAADALPADGEWNGFIEALSGYINGAGLGTLSVEDYLAYDDAASEVNWRVPAGYGTLVSASLPPVALHLSTPVERIAEDGPALKLVTPRGDIRARSVIVTVATNVLAKGGLRLPAALDDHAHAAACLPLGLADKLFLAFDDADVPRDSHLLGKPKSACTGSYYLRPFGRPVVEVFLGGAGAMALEDVGLDGAAAFAIDEMAALLGNGVRGKLRLIAGSAWARTDGFGGSYSHALPGHHAARAALATPWQDRLFFAGEACSPTDFSTAHGALATGIAAADAVLAQRNSISSSIRP
ncbi:amine oxidase [Sphingomonas sp. Leaf33]|uniref:flavin monoamine oxidase family protein n=1 Tax=Sphingomonas sp. Leaf33 TaxID=1736215 RepID=UPI000700A876|nr:NAD(P)/FAD-dependent oxidoreductase [Sphingomonas sp. Leaf33]KQN25990.1 amine oxidase [Sphingomonas sp. Leaf33]